VRTIKPHTGRFAATVWLPAWARHRRITVRVSYPGDARVRQASRVLHL
jgi:hypothetical protein